MSYAAGEAAALTILRTLSYFDADNSCSFENKTFDAMYGQMSKGPARSYAFLRRGAFKREWLTLTRLQTTWETVIEIWVRNIDPGSTYQTLAQIGQAVVDEFDKYITLNDTAGVQYSALARGDEPEIVELRRRWGAKNEYMKQNLTLVWREETTPARADGT